MEFLMQLTTGILMGFVDLVLLPLRIYQWVQLETLKEKMDILLLAGMSREFFFILLATIVVVLVAGIYSHRFLEGIVLALERFNGTVGKIAAWFAIIMMLQQVLIIAMGQVFRGNELIFAPLGLVMTSNELQWLSGQLKFYNAILIAVASGYTFIEGGHVRVDLFYSVAKYRAKKWIDLIGTLIFLFPSSILLWWFAWPIAANSMFAQRPMNMWSDKAKWRSLRLEASGTAEFSWVWTFKVLILVFAGLLFIVAVSFLLRNVLALLERNREFPSHYSLDDKSQSEPHPVG